MTLPPRQTRALPRDDPAVGDEGAGDDRALADAEDLADLGPALDDLDDLRLEQALERGLDVVGELVDDVVEPDVDAFGLGRPPGGLGDLRVEADHDRVRRGRQHDVVVGDVAGALEQDVEPDVLLVELLERVGDRAERAGHVGLEDDPQLLGLAGLDLAVEVLEGGAATPLPALGGATALRASTIDRASFSSPTTRRMSPASGTSARPSTTTAVDGPALVTRLPLSFSSARTRPNVSPTTMMSPTLSVPVWTSAVATGAATLVQLRLDDRADRRALRVGLELLQVGDQQDHLDQLVEPDPGLGRDRHHRHVAAVLLDDDAGLGQLGLDPVRVGVGLVDLVEGDDDRHLGRLGVADRLERLGHDAVVGGDDDHRDVGDPGAAGAHGGERLVARRVEEDDALAVVGDLARADVLGDPAALAGGDLGRPDGVEQAGLAVVDVAHHGDDRSARLEERRVVLLEQDLLGRLGDRPVGLRLRPGRPAAWAASATS